MHQKRAAWFCRQRPAFAHEAHDCHQKARGLRKSSLPRILARHGCFGGHSHRTFPSEALLTLCLSLSLSLSLPPSPCRCTDSHIYIYIHTYIYIYVYIYVYVHFSYTYSTHSTRTYIYIYIYMYMYIYICVCIHCYVYLLHKGAFFFCPEVLGDPRSQPDAPTPAPHSSSGLPPWVGRIIAVLQPPKGHINIRIQMWCIV